jgi:hypothetical protein
MKTRLILAALACVALSTPALTQETAAACTRPTPPEKLDGATASMDQLKAAKDQTSSFIAASDTFQACVLKDLADRKAAAKAAKAKFPAEQTTAANAQVDANQADKATAGENFNAAVKAYKTAHPA